MQDLLRLEDKFFDKKRSVLDSRIIGLALIANKENPETGDLSLRYYFGSGILK